MWSGTTALIILQTLTLKGIHAVLENVHSGVFHFILPLPWWEELVSIRNANTKQGALLNTREKSPLLDPSTISILQAYPGDARIQLSSVRVAFLEDRADFGCQPLFSGGKR